MPDRGTSIYYKPFFNNRHQKLEFTTYYGVQKSFTGILQARV